MDRIRWSLDGRGLDNRCCRHGDHHYRPAVDTSGIQHCCLHPAALSGKKPFHAPNIWTSRLGHWTAGVLGNVLWLVLAGWWLALGHLITAIMLAITIVGIPFAWAHVKLAGLALWPIGKIVVYRLGRPRSRVERLRILVDHDFALHHQHIHSMHRSVISEELMGNPSPS